MTSASEQSPPQGWCNRQLHDLCYVVGGGTPSRSQPKYWNGDIPWASVKDFSDEAVFLHDTKEHITQEGLESSTSTLVQANTPVVCTRMAVGRCALTIRPTAINQDLKALLLRDSFDLRFFIRLLKFHSSILDRVSVGSTVRGITTHDLLSLALCYPDKSEQSRIAAVLDTVDEAIAKTEAVIAKLKQVRAGLLHDLLTRGLDEHGQLRDPIAHPEQFQDSPMGRIPRAWGVTQLRQVADVASGVTLGRNLDGVGTLELPYLRVANVQDGYLDLADVKTIRIFPDELDRFRLRCGDVLMNEGGDYDKLGRGTVWEEQIPVCLHQNHVFRVRCRPDVLNCYFLAAISGSEIGKRYFLRSSKQSTNLASINSTQLNAFEIPVPNLDEQEAVIKILKVQDDQIINEARVLDKLHALKSGLMADLLTGRVRVPELEAGRRRG